MMKLTSHENSAHAVVIGKKNSRVSVCVAAMALLVVMQAASAQSSPASTSLEGAGVIDNAILLLHWTNASGQSLLVPEYQQALFASGAPLDAKHYFVIIPDNIGHGRSSKPTTGAYRGRYRER
jgi:pimeloyl-ACP methyl ester carboxylesterase